MQYSPKLKNAMKEITSILQRYDIGALVILHTPGNSEYLLKVDPTYSCAWTEGDKMRIRARLKEDFSGDKEAQKKALTDTVNLFSCLSTTGDHVLSQLDTISVYLDAITKADHFGSGNTSESTQNN